MRLVPLLRLMRLPWRELLPCLLPLPWLILLPWPVLLPWLVMRPWLLLLQWLLPLPQLMLLPDCRCVFDSFFGGLEKGAMDGRRGDANAVSAPGRRPPAVGPPAVALRTGPQAVAADIVADVDL